MARAIRKMFTFRACALLAIAYGRWSLRYNELRERMTESEGPEVGMAEVTLPVVKGVYLCDDIQLNPGRDKFYLLGTFSTFRPSEGPPYRLGRLCIFAQLAEVTREVSVQAVVLKADNREEAFRTGVHPLRRPASPLVVVPVVFRYTDGEFRQPGVYLVELLCDGQFVDDRRLYVIPRTESVS